MTSKSALLLPESPSARLRALLPVEKVAFIGSVLGNSKIDEQIEKGEHLAKTARLYLYGMCDVEDFDSKALSIGKRASPEDQAKHTIIREIFKAAIKLTSNVEFDQEEEKYHLVLPTDSDVQKFAGRAIFRFYRNIDDTPHPVPEVHTVLSEGNPDQVIYTSDKNVANTLGLLAHSA